MQGKQIGGLSGKTITRSGSRTTATATAREIEDLPLEQVQLVAP